MWWHTGKKRPTLIRGAPCHMPHWSSAAENNCLPEHACSILASKQQQSAEAARAEQRGMLRSPHRANTLPLPAAIRASTVCELPLYFILVLPVMSSLPFCLPACLVAPAQPPADCPTNAQDMTGFKHPGFNMQTYEPLLLAMP